MVRLVCSGVAWKRIENFSSHTASSPSDRYGFNGGSALLLNVPNRGSVATIVAVNTSLAAAAGGASTLLTNFYIGMTFYGETRVDVPKTMNGCLAGLVAITSPCATVEPWCALLIGIIAGWIYLGTSDLLIRMRVDDAVDGIPIHMGGGAFGLIATGLFSSPRKLELAFAIDSHPGLFYSIGELNFDARLLACQFAALCFIIAWTTTLMLPVSDTSRHVLHRAKQPYSPLLASISRSFFFY